MAVVNKMMGTNGTLLVGTKMIGCAEKVDFGIDVNMVATKCQGNGNVETASPGMRKYSCSLSGIERVFTGTDATTNVSVNDLWDSAVAGAETTIVFQGVGAGDVTHTLVGYLQNVKESHNQGDVSKWDATFYVNSHTRTAIA